MTLTLGVDPGASGAVALLDEQGQLIACIDMPNHDGLVSGTLLVNALHRWGVSASNTQCWIEDVHSMPKQGVASSFKFGRAHGTVIGVLAGQHLTTHYVTPAKWKKYLALTADKAVCRRRAVELWPVHAGLFSRVKDDGRAEAALIARYGWLTHHTEGARA